MPLVAPERFAAETPASADLIQLIGWYRAADGAVQSKGSLYFTLHPRGVTAEGRWVGLSYDGKIITGYGALCRDQDAVEPAIADMKTQGGAR